MEEDEFYQAAFAAELLEEQDDIRYNRSYEERSKGPQRTDLVREYAWAIPNRLALETIASYSPIVEMGAGSGYWAACLRQMGVDIVVYDANLPTEYKGVLPLPRERRQWTVVLDGTPEILSQHRDRALLLCWPPYSEPMAADCLKIQRPDYLLFVGEGEGGCTADEEFFRMLRSDYYEVKMVEIPQFWAMHDYLFVYHRKCPHVHTDRESCRLCRLRDSRRELGSEKDS